MHWVIAGLAFTLLPIWRSGVHSRKEGRNLWQFMTDLTQEEYYPFGQPHIPYDEAVEQAKEAYQRCGLSRRSEG